MQTGSEPNPGIFFCVCILKAAFSFSFFTKKIMLVKDNVFITKYNKNYIKILWGGGVK